MPLHVLASMTWTAVRDLAAKRPVAVLPAGAVEAHGPHLPLGTDIIIAEAMARRGAERLSGRGIDVVLLPPLMFAPAPFAAAFAGTINTSPETTRSAVVGIATSLADHGVTLTVLANAHHDPAHVDALRLAVADLAASGRATLLFPDLTKRRWAEKLTEEFRSGACHAGRYETSIVLAERPAQVRADVMAALRPNPRSLVHAIESGHHTFEAAGGPDAYFGAPAEASAEEGRAIVDVLGAIVEEAVVEHDGRQP